MSAEWPYAKLAKLASKYGGPEKLIGLVKSRAFQEGVKTGKIKLIPIALGTLGLGVLGTVGIQKFQEHKYSKLTKSKVTATEVAEAEDLLIKGMKAAEQDESEQSLDIDEDIYQKNGGVLVKKNNNPYKISEDDWDDPDFESYDKVFVGYDRKTGTLTEMSGITYNDEERAAIGEGNICSLIDGTEDLIYVRNERLEIDYEITRC